MNIREALDKVHLFSHLEPQTKEEIARFVSLKKYERSELLFAENTKAEGFFAVLSGLVKVFKTSWEGKEQVLHFFGPYEIFAEVPVFHGADYPASAEALEACEVLFIPSEPFLNFLRHHGEVAIKLLGIMSERLRYFTRLIEDLALKEVPARLSAYILYRRQQEKEAPRIALDIPKNLLAGLLGTTPETLSRAFYKLKQIGCIDTSGKVVIIVNKPCLERIALEGKVGDE